MSQVHVVFDWDGTLSFIRAGWAEIMLRQWLEEIPAMDGESPAALRARAHDEIWALNGKPSIHQMNRLAELVAERGGRPRTGDEYQADFQARLGRQCAARLDAVRTGQRPAGDFLVLGARPFLERLAAGGVVLHLVSGTPRDAVVAEADVLGLRPFFEDRLHGPTSLGDVTFHKRETLDALVARHAITADRLVAFGDGHVEISETKALGGRAVAVAADEEHWHSGRTDDAKRERLMALGADRCIPDYDGPEELAGWVMRPAKFSVG
jgi:phosphoglycolate phosphatase